MSDAYTDWFRQGFSFIICLTSLVLLNLLLVCFSFQGVYLTKRILESSSRVTLFFNIQLLRLNFQLRFHIKLWKPGIFMLIIWLWVCWLFDCEYKFIAIQNSILKLNNNQILKCKQVQYNGTWIHFWLGLFYLEDYALLFQESYQIMV